MPVPNPASIASSGGDFSTIQAWEDALVNDEGVLLGDCYQEAFSNVIFGGVAYDADNYPRLAAGFGWTHDGRAHEVSGAGNARIESFGAFQSGVFLTDPFIRVSWLEIKGPGDNGEDGVRIGGGSGSIHHCIIHNNHENSGISKGIMLSVGTTGWPAVAYRNIIYGYGRGGIRANFVTTGLAGILCNTCYENNHQENASIGGITTVDTGFEIKNNACFDNFNADIFGTAGILDYNATSDTTGDDEGANGIANLTTANQFIAPTDTWADTDLLHKSGADLIGAGTTFSPATYPEINVSIRNGATRATITGDWDIGADQFEEVVAVGVSVGVLQRGQLPGILSRGSR